MINPVQGIVGAGNALERLYGKKGYKLLVEKMKEKTHNDPQVQMAIYKDESMTAEVRLVALATVGE